MSTRFQCVQVHTCVVCTLCDDNDGYCFQRTHPSPHIHTPTHTHTYTYIHAARDTLHSRLGVALWKSVNYGLGVLSQALAWTERSSNLQGQGNMGACRWQLAKRKPWTGWRLTRWLHGPSVPPWGSTVTTHLRRVRGRCWGSYALHMA